MEQMPMPHDLSLKERGLLRLTGVSQVLNFDENTVVLDTTLGRLLVQGTDLKLKTLSPEGVVVEGKVSALVYEEKRPSLWRRR